MAAAIPIPEEQTFMTEQSMRTPAAGRSYERMLDFLKNAALVVTIVGAIPTAITAYHAWNFGVPFTQVPARLAQYDLWVKNIDCHIDYKALSTTQGTVIDVGACPKTGDIALKVSAADGRAAYQWIAYDELQKPGQPMQSKSFIDMLISAARADESAPKPFKLAQGMQVVCQAKKGNQIVRVVNEGGKCFREVISPLKGAVEERSEVSCDAGCG
ncbi:MAG: hypothetical protein NW216_15235 [Hyphomicrobium sp.]|nr:hypothetical protein [Hyphomicrobium sp.]